MKDIQVFEIIKRELHRQQDGVELIASENFASQQVLDAMGTWLNNKYAEGYPNKRYYGGCQYIDQVEQLAIDRLKQLFGAEYANVQPHSGAQANAAVFLALLQPSDAILGFDLSHGGHLSHGSKVNFSGKYFKSHFYGVDKDSGFVDMEQVRLQAQSIKPKLIICGASAYSRDWDYPAFRAIADEVGAILLADIAHPAGLIAAKLLSDPLPYCHIVTSTTHKTLRGPRGGIIMMGKDFPNPWGRTTKKGKIIKMSSILNSAVFPGMQGGPLEHIIAAKAVAFGEALQLSWIDYSKQVISNAQAMARGLIDLNYKIVSNGTDNHLMLIDLSNKNVTGKQLDNALEQADITINKNMVPFDPRSPFDPSGIRIGTPAITTRGFVEKDCLQVVEWIDDIVKDVDNHSTISRVRIEVNKYMKNFPLYPQN